MPITDIFITHISAKQSAFGIRLDTSEEVYIHPRFVIAGEIVDGDTVRAELLPNTPDLRDKTPWMVLRVMDNHPIVDIKTPTTVLEESVYAILEQYQMLTTQEVADLVKTDVASVSTALHSLFDRNMCVKAQVYLTPTQTEAEFYVWAIDADDFRGE